MSSSTPTPKPPRGSRLIAFVFAMVAMVLIPYALTVFFELDGGPHAGIMIASYSPKVPGGPRDYTVYSCGYELLTRTVATENQYETEVLLWHLIPVVTLLAVCAVLGWHVGRWVSRRVASRAT